MWHHVYRYCGQYWCCNWHVSENLEHLRIGFAHSLLELHALLLRRANTQSRTQQLASHRKQNLPNVALNNGAANHCESEANASSQVRLYKYRLYGRSIVQTRARFEKRMRFGGNSECDSVYFSLESMWIYYGRTYKSTVTKLQKKIQLNCIGIFITSHCRGNTLTMGTHRITA